MRSIPVGYTMGSETVTEQEATASIISFFVLFDAIVLMEE